MNPGSALLNVFAGPARLFAQVRARPRPLLPIVVLALLTAATSYGYFLRVDFGWLGEHLLSARTDLSAASKAEVLRRLSPGLLTWSSVGGALLFGPMLAALYAGYLFLVARALGADVHFRQWLALSAWCAMPRLLVLALMGVQVLRMDAGRLGMEELDLTSANALVFALPLSHAWATLAGSMDIATWWVPILLGMGFSQWVGISVVRGVLIATAPALTVYGAWCGKILVLG